MTHSVQQVEFIDTTLREGLQGAIKPFAPGISPSAYAQAVTSELNTTYAEIYGPDIYYSSQDYEAIVEVLGSRLQLYCGVLANFDADKKPHIKQLAAPRLSLTVIDKNAAAIDKVKSILELYPKATLRLGMECANSANQSAMIEFLEELNNIERVTNITLSDSNGTMTPLVLRDLIANLPHRLNATLGFHLHNDKGLAVANALTALEALAITGQKVSLDYTFYGLGERYGLLSLQEIAALGHDIVKGDTQEEVRKIGRLFTEEASHFHRLPYTKDVVHVAASHFDKNGQLRPEYRDNNK